MVSVDVKPKVSKGIGRLMGVGGWLAVEHVYDLFPITKGCHTHTRGLRLNYHHARDMNHTNMWRKN